MQVVTLEPGDVLVLKVDEGYTIDEEKALRAARKAFERVFKDNKVVIVEGVSLYKVV